MKILRLFTAITLLGTIPCMAADTTDSAIETQIQGLNLDKLDFNNLPECEAGALSTLLGSASEEQDNASTGALYGYRSQNTIIPYAQGMGYVRGELCHIGNYATSTIITVFEGPNYGLQTVIDYYGVVRYVNRNCRIEYNSHGGITMKHGYPDCVVVTGSEQIVIFY